MSNKENVTLTLKSKWMQNGIVRAAGKKKKKWGKKKERETET